MFLAVAAARAPCYVIARRLRPLACVRVIARLVCGVCAMLVASPYWQCVLRTNLIKVGLPALSM